MREALGIRPGSAVSFALDEGAIRLTVAAGHERRGRELVRRLRGSATTRLTTDEIMALTRD